MSRKNPTDIAKLKHDIRNTLTMIKLELHGLSRREADANPQLVEVVSTLENELRTLQEQIDALCQHCDP